MIYSDIDVSMNDTVVVRSYFKNTGDSVVDVYMRGNITKKGESVHRFQTDSVKILPEEFYTFEYTYFGLEDGEYVLDTEFGDGNFILDDDERVFYSSDAISLETNFVIIFILIIFLLVISHYLLSRRKDE